MGEFPWEAMYRALLRRVTQIANSKQDHQTIVADLRVVTNAHRTLPANVRKRTRRAARD